ncbi:MAG: molybdopterin molybdotransferase MoeA [Gammaproteobacteria bacterium]
MTDKNTTDRDCCDDPHIGNALTLSDALARIRATLQPVEGSESVALADALDRILDEDIVASVDVPGHTNSAMDGYAVRADDLPASETGQCSLALIGTAWAGRGFDGNVSAGECVRIMTGAPLPAGADTVVMQEHVELDGEQVIIGQGNRPGQHVRKAGEDIARGDIALAAGVVLKPAQLGVLASIGCSEFLVRRRTRVAFFSTGDELRPVGSQLEKGQIHDSNRHTIRGMLQRLSVDIVDLGIVRDRREDIEQAFHDAANKADAIITTGGVSVGDADFVTEILEKTGEVNFWKVAIKPGRPLAYGRVSGTPFFGLPGHPVSVMATFYQIVQPMLEVLSGVEQAAPSVLVDAVCRSTLRKKPGRMEVQRGVLELGDDGCYIVRSTGRQGSGVLSSMIEANCFIVLPLEQATTHPGDVVKVQPFRCLV